MTKKFEQIELKIFKSNTKISKRLQVKCTLFKSEKNMSEKRNLENKKNQKLEMKRTSKAEKRN